MTAAARRAAVRITPAWAGKSLFSSFSRLRFEDYPRVGGEEYIMGMKAELETGLPPRGRGRGNVCTEGGAFIGITPAWAGKSYAFQWPRHSDADYPRVGGEEAFQEEHFQWIQGLPPRGRGRVCARYVG